MMRKNLEPGARRRRQRERRVHIGAHIKRPRLADDQIARHRLERHDLRLPSLEPDPPAHEEAQRINRRGGDRFVEMGGHSAEFFDHGLHG